MAPASWLNSLEAGVRRDPRRILIYGSPKVGKSTFGASSPRPVFIDIEDGTGALNCVRFPRPQNVGEVYGMITSLVNDQHDFQTLVVDSLDWFERMCEAEVKHRLKCQSLADLDWGQGYAALANEFGGLFTYLDWLRAERRMNIILIAHSEIERYQPPDMPAFDRHRPKLNKRCWPLAVEWADDLLFATIEIITRQAGPRDKRIQAVSKGTRVLRCVDRGNQVGGNRASLPDVLPLDWRAYAAAIEDFYASLESGHDGRELAAEHDTEYLDGAAFAAPEEAESKEGH